jgi:hypothetical protein
MTIFQIIFAPLCACASIWVLLRSWQGRGLRRNGVFWGLVWLVAGFLILFPSVTTRLAGWFGIGRGADLILYLAILAGLTSSLYFYARYRQLEIMVTEIIRREALSAPVHGTPSAPANIAQPPHSEPRHMLDPNSSVIRPH